MRGNDIFMVSVKGQTVSSLNDELQREISESHSLGGKMLNAIARSVVCDDVLYIDQDSRHYYLVHLNWDRERVVSIPIIKCSSA